MNTQDYIVSTFRLRLSRFPLSLSARDNGVGERNEGPSPSIIISHAVVRECVYLDVAAAGAETSVDSMLFPLITFIIGFKVSRPSVKNVSSVSLAGQAYDSDWDS